MEGTMANTDSESSLQKSLQGGGIPARKGGERILSSYEIVERLLTQDSSDGLWHTYLCKDMSHKGRPQVVVKQPNKATGQMAELLFKRLAEEMGWMAASDNGVPTLVRPYVAGLSLFQWKNRQGDLREHQELCIDLLNDLAAKIDAFHKSKKRQLLDLNQEQIVIEANNDVHLLPKASILLDCAIANVDVMNFGWIAGELLFGLASPGAILLKPREAQRPKEMEDELWQVLQEVLEGKVHSCGEVMASLVGHLRLAATVGKPFDVELSKTVALKMQWIQPGEFEMGSPKLELGRGDDDQEQHHEKIADGFWLGVYPVTQKQFLELMAGENTSTYPGDENPMNTLT